MPMFPTRRYSMATIPGVTPLQPAQDQYDPLQIGQRRRRRGLGGIFDGPARGIVRREDGDPGTLLNYALFGQGGVETMRDRAEHRQLFPLGVRREKLEQAQIERAANEPYDTPDNFGPLETIDGRLGQPNRTTGEYQWAPQVPLGPRAGRTQYRPVTPEEAQQYNLPGNGTGFVMGDNGRPIRVGGGGTFSADQRARVEIGIEPALEAVRILDQIETNNGALQSRRSPRNSQWGASLLDSVDGEGTGAVARNWGGQEFQRYTSAGSSFESAMLPILSGAAVTPSEAARLIRAALPQLGDGPDVLRDKARRRQQMLNGAAAIGGREPPYPEAGVPEWATNYSRALENAGAGEDDSGLPDGVTQEEWDVMTPEERALFQ